MTDLHRNKTFLWILALGFATVSLAMLGARSLVLPDEGRYAEIAREMFASGDWVTTRLNGIKYFEKPPLQAWMTALSFTLFGLGEWQARLWTGLCGLAGVGLTALAAWRTHGGRVGLYSTLVLGSCFYWSLWSQIDSLDMGLAAALTLSWASLLLAQRDDAAPTARRSWMLACWAGMALAVLSKVLIGVVLPAVVLVLYTVAVREWGIWRRLHLVKGMLLLACIAAPWFVLVGMRNPEQPHFFFIYEHVDRFLLKEHHREAAWWIFLVLLAVGSLPWLGASAQGMVSGAKGEPGRFRRRLLSLIWIVFIVAFFSKSSSKLPGYILPVFPAVALLAGHRLASASRRSLMGHAGTLIATGLVMFMLAPFVKQFGKGAGEALLYGAYRPWILAAAAAALAGGAAAYCFAAAMRRDLAVTATALGAFFATQLLMAGAEPLGRARAGIDLLPPLRAELRPESRLYSVGLYEQSLTFYLQRPVTLVAYRDEFDFGLQQQPELGIPTIPAFIRQWREDTAAGRPALALIRTDLLAELRRQGLPIRVVAADERRAVIANR